MQIRVSFEKKTAIIKNIFGIFFFTLSIAGCGKICVESRGIEGAGLTVDFIHAGNGQYFYPDDVNLFSYPLDSLQVTDSRGNILHTAAVLNSDPTNPLKKYYRVDIYPIFIPSQDQNAFTNEEVKQIYIKYNHNTFDTITLVYKVQKEKCYNNYTYLKAYHRNSLLSEIYKKPQGLIFTINH